MEIKNDDWSTYQKQIDKNIELTSWTNIIKIENNIQLFNNLIIKMKNIKSMTRSHQDYLNDLSKWAFYSSFIFSPEKTKCIILFTKKKRISKPKLFL